MIRASRRPPPPVCRAGARLTPVPRRRKRRRHRDELWCVRRHNSGASKDALKEWSKAVLPLIICAADRARNTPELPVPLRE